LNSKFYIIGVTSYHIFDLAKTKTQQDVTHSFKIQNLEFLLTFLGPYKQNYQ